MQRRGLRIDVLLSSLVSSGNRERCGRQDIIIRQPRPTKVRVPYLVSLPEAQDAVLLAAHLFDLRDNAVILAPIAFAGFMPQTLLRAPDLEF